MRIGQRPESQWPATLRESLSLYPKIDWPDGKQFAFTVFDDTDLQNLANAPPVYRFLGDLGFRTTKSIWPTQGSRCPKVGGMTCETPQYLAWVKQLQAQGFEIGLHNVTYHTSTREETCRGIDRFREFFGHDPHTMANHVACEESLYWGQDRVTDFNRWIYRILAAWKPRKTFLGHVQGSKLFWGDTCRERIKYVRNFVFNNINTLRACPHMPYHDPTRPYVRFWFASSEGATVESFNRRISELNQDQLEAEGGACIMYTHYACGFYQDGRMNRRFQALMERLSRKNGWFVPVSTLLDYLLVQKVRPEITSGERARLERRWLWHKVRVGKTT